LAAQAQKQVWTQKVFNWLKVNNDSTYVKDETRKLTVRAFGSNKFSKYTPGDYGFDRNLSYSANNNYNIGIGATYKYVGFNIESKIPFINNDMDRYGKTKFLDLQTFVYLRKFTVDLYYLSYKGYYLSDREIITTPVAEPDAYPQRPDLGTRNIGLNVQYIFNNKRYSFRAAFLQNEYQKKSAGSFMVGGGVHNIRVKADSAVIPLDIRFPGYFGNNTFNYSNTTNLSINAGYAYTLVIHQHFFVTAALMAGPGVNYTVLRDDVNSQAENKISAVIGGTIRGAAGYNSEYYFVGVQYINFINRNSTPVPGAWQEFQNGNVHLTVAKRFKLQRKTQKALDKIENKVKKELNIKGESDQQKKKTTK
jgi:hypothetical protein